MPPPPPPHDPRAGYGVESSSVVTAPDRHMSRGTPSRRPLWPRRWPDISPEPSPLLPSTQGGRYGEHQYHRARDESSPCFHSPCRGSESLPSSSKRCPPEGARKGSSVGGHWSDDDDAGTGSRCQYDHELAYPSSCHRAHRHLGSNKRAFSPRHHGGRSSSVQHRPSPRGKPQLPLPMEMSPWDDGYTSPSSPSYAREVEQYRQRGLHDDDQDMTPDCLYSAPGSSDGSGIFRREPSFKYEDPVLNTESKDFAYDALVDDFMDAVAKTGRNRNPNLEVDKDAHEKQTNRFAELALKRYNKNKNNKVKYALVEAIDGGAIWEDSEIYAHVNFYAKAKNGPKKHDGKVLVFAELHQVGRRLNAMVLTCFRFLDESNQLCGRYDQPRNSLIRQNQDPGHCYACSDIIKHPDGSCYKAGHIVCTLYYLCNYSVV
ncbi:uncharacterized protein [Triticum aestivum]|uniref:uncharacterized protein isoform X2 n=1 Tax=Triticum aestivum TaxID=4565 RepID=UPI001D01A16D|nr:uncharacterized protein LOC123087937 isoform X2 [Triticum aestivum]